MSQTRALLLTDVVDSTKLSAELGDAAMAQVWAAHDRAARDLLLTWRGRELGKTDGMLLLFDDVADAVGFALAYHQALATLPAPLKARAGLHVGSVALRENSAEDVERGAKPIEIDGLAISIAARVMSLALGCQTLLSEDARRALSEGEWALQSHGHWILKGLAEPVELFEVGADKTAFTTPPDGEKAYRVALVAGRWVPVEQVPNNLPQQTTSFIGGERARHEVRAALETSRLVTLLGMGGLGKTRLSLQVAAEVMVRFPDGVWFLDLAPIRDAALVVVEAAQMLNVREEPGRPLVQSICAVLKSRRALLIFDNCEHLINASAELAGAILRATPHACILATSREALRVPGEQCYPVLPLALPRQGDDLEAVSRSTAVRLFVERARSHKPAFVLNEQEAPAVTELVARLEGIPLALELAAARVRAMSVTDINSRLKDRYKLLTGGGRVLLERQQTLRALVDWSYDMLSEAERTVLNRLAVFAGGFDIEAAEQICGADPLKASDVLDLVTSLVEKSLVMTDEHGRVTRYRILETIRDYAREKLEQAGDLEPTAARHCQHYFSFAKAVNNGMVGSEQSAWIARMEAELDNVRAGIALAMDGGVDPIIAVKLAVAMQGFWIMRGYATEGRAAVSAMLALAAVRASDQAQGHALYVGAALAQSQSDHTEARTMLEQCLTLRRRLGNEIDIAATLSTLAVTCLATGDVDVALERAQEALAIFQQRGDRVGEAIVLGQLGQISMRVGADAQARAYIAGCVALACQLGHRELEAECELVIGELDFESRAPVPARERFTRSLTICRVAADKRGEANALWWLAKVDLEDGDFATARMRLDEALQAFWAFEMREELLGCLEDHASLARTQAVSDLAVRLAAAAATARQRLNLIRSPRAERRWKAQLDSLRETVTSTAFDVAWSEGQTWPVDHAVRMALSKQGQLHPT